MKRLISLITIALLLICMGAPVVVFAVPGEDAHSDTMTVEADGQSVEEKQANEQVVVDEVVEEEESLEPLDTSAGEELAEDAEAATDDVFSTMSANWIYIAAGIGSMAAIIIAVVAVKSSKSKHKNSVGAQDYKAKH